MFIRNWRRAFDCTSVGDFEGALRHLVVFDDEVHMGGLAYLLRGYVCFKLKYYRSALSHLTKAIELVERRKKRFGRPSQHDKDYLVSFALIHILLADQALEGELLTYEEYRQFKNKLWGRCHVDSNLVQNYYRQCFPLDLDYIRDAFRGHAIFRNRAGS